MPDHATLSATQTCREMSRWPGRLELAKVPHLVLLTPAICKDCNTVTNHPESICFPASMEDVGWVLRYYLHLFALHSYQNSFKSQVTGPDYFGLLFTLISVYLVIFTSFSFIWHSFDWRQDLCHSIDRLWKVAPRRRWAARSAADITCNESMMNDLERPMNGHEITKTTSGSTCYEDQTIPNFTSSQSSSWIENDESGTWKPWIWRKLKEW
jgi:hypothetical protein